MDIDGGRPGQLCYPWTWVPTTENLMYMMPQAGTRVSRYFRGDEEESVLTVNCIRGGKGCREANPLDKSLTTEHGMQMRLCRCDMGVVTLKEKVLLDDLTGIRMEGSGGLHIVADGEVKLVWKHGIIGETNEFLPSNKAGRFDAASGILYLRSNPVQYEVWHEVSHCI